MDWAWWGTVGLTVGLMVATYLVMAFGLFARAQGYAEHPRAIAARSGWWFALSAVFLLPSGLFFLFYGWKHGGNAPFAARFPRADAYWLEFVPASFNPAVRDEFAGHFEASLTVLTVLAGLAAAMGLYRLYWQPWGWLRQMARAEGVPLTSGFALKVLARHFTLTTLQAIGAALFLTLALQTLFYLLGHAVATAFFVLPFALGLLFLAAMGAASGGKDIYDRHGKKIGSVK